MTRLATLLLALALAAPGPLACRGSPYPTPTGDVWVEMALPGRRQAAGRGGAGGDRGAAGAGLPGARRLWALGGVHALPKKSDASPQPDGSAEATTS